MAWGCLPNRTWPARAWWMAIALGVLANGGCSDGETTAVDSGRQPVTGQVLVGGKPALGVEVRLHPLNRFGDADAPRPYGTTDADGRFRLRTSANEEGAPAGQYTATLIWPTGPGRADRLGGAFAEPDGSGFVAVIPDQPTELPPFVVSAPGRTGGSH